MTPITLAQYDAIRASSASAQAIFRLLSIRGWPTVFRTASNEYFLRHS